LEGPTFGANGHDHGAIRHCAAAICRLDWDHQKEAAMPKTLVCDPALFEKDLKGKTYIVTGANSGSGFATTEQLAKQGAHVVMACRRMDAAKEAAAKIENVPGSVEVMELNLGSLASVRNFAMAFSAKHQRLDGLVNNAGVMNSPNGKTEDGFETQFGVNHLGHFLLTELLLEPLKRSAPSRVVLVSSVAHAGMSGQPADIDFDDLFFDKRKYNGTLAYNQSKLAMVVYARHLAKRLEGTGVRVFATHPGWIRSNLVKNTMPAWVQNVVMRPFSGLLGMISWEEGAQTQLHCLLDDEVVNHSGEFYSQNSVLYANKENKAGGWPMRSPNPKVYDDALGERLYDVSLELVGLKKQAAAA
jgi:light-dependent protochlorophyllide reductase